MVELYLSTTCACLEIGAAATINPDAVFIESPAVTFFTAGVAQLFVETHTSVGVGWTVVAVHVVG